MGFRLISKATLIAVLPGQVGDRVGDEVITNPVTMHKTQKQSSPNAWQMISCGFLAFSSASMHADTAAMPGGDAPSPGPPRVRRLPKKRIPIDLSVSPAKTMRGSPPNKKLKQQNILLSMLVGGEAMG
jgi:hypothetical protein